MLLAMIRNLRAYIAAIRDWSWLDDVLPRGCRVMDVDGALILPRGALFFENKSGPNPPTIPAGQYIAHRTLSDRGWATVLYLLWDGDEICAMRILDADGDTGWMEASKEDVKRYVTDWVRTHDATEDLSGIRWRALGEDESWTD